MACGIRKQLTNSGAAAGTDLDSIFKARTSAAGANVNVRAVSGTPGQDLAQRFEPRGTSPKVADVGYRSPGGVDISNLFMDASYVAVATLGFNGQSYLASRSSSGTTPTSALTLWIKADGTWEVRKNFGSPLLLASGNWLTAAGGGVASDYQVKFTGTNTGGGAGVFTNGAPAFTAVNADKTINFAVTGTDVWDLASITAEIRRVSDSVITANGTCEFQCEVLAG